MYELEKTIPAAPPPDEPPDWLQVLRAECARTKSQAKVAKRLGVSGSTISQVLSGNYAASTAHVEARVRGELMNETVSCPVLGELSKRKCLDNQADPFAATNPQRVQLYKACRANCPHSSICED